MLAEKLGLLILAKKKKIALRRPAEASQRSGESEVFVNRFKL